MEGYLADLRRASVRGVHLFCGADPVAFYRKLGFDSLNSVECRGAAIFAMGRRL